MRSSSIARTARVAGRHVRPLQGLTVLASALLVLGVSVLIGVPGGPAAPVWAAPVSAASVPAAPAVSVSRAGSVAGPSSIKPSSNARAALHAAAEPARAPYLAAVSAFSAQRRTETDSIARAAAVLDSAGLALAESAGRVLDDGSRTELAAGIRALEAAVVRAGRTVDQANLMVASSGSYFSAAAEFVQATDRLREGSGVALDRLSDEVTDAARTVADAVAAWQAEQDRAAAELVARAAAEAERIAAEAQAAAANAAADGTGARAANGASGGGTASSSGAEPPTAPASVDKYVWTNGFQSEIDACNGAVDVTGNYGVPVIAEHWSCGGAWFPGSGTVITLSGVRSGTYLVGGVAAVLNANTQGTRDVPRGYDLLYQTCINGSNSTMSFTVLTRVG